MLSDGLSVTLFRTDYYDEQHAVGHHSGLMRYPVESEKLFGRLSIASLNCLLLGVVDSPIVRPPSDVLFADVVVTIRSRSKVFEDNLFVGFYGL